MPSAHSPLRYPGGKQILTRVIAHLIRINDTGGGVYVEPYAGGAGAAIGLLFGEHVHRIMINDADYCVFAMWSAILNQSSAFLDLIQGTPLTVAEWGRQRAIYQNPRKHKRLLVGFATFYLNRCNRSGIIKNGGPIGGKGQEGTWKIDARFNRSELCRRVQRISLYKDRIQLFNMDGIALLREQVAPLRARDRPFVYLDPPYYGKGEALYLNYYQPADHDVLARYLRNEAAFNWILSYDDVAAVRKLYTGFQQVRFSLDYSARERRTGREIMILRSGLAFPTAWQRTIPSRYITAADSAPAMPSQVACAG